MLVTVDTLRGDHVCAGRAGEALTPFLDRLAERSVLYREAMSAADATTPGTAGVLTGVFPARSGVIANNHVIAPAVPTLAATLQAGGFRTGAFVSNPNLREGAGFERGFEVYQRVRPAEAGEEKRAKVRAEEVNAAALAWLDGLDPSRERVFLWVHYMEPHGPYQPPGWTRELFPTEAFDAPRELPLLADNSGRAGIPVYQRVGVEDERAADGRDYEARYAGEVRAIDEGLRLLFEGLEQRGVLDDALWVVTADHGEALGERGFWFSHANGASRDQVHVPLILGHRGCAAGSVVERVVSTLDVAPTALELLGFPVPDQLDGRSLLADGPALVFSWSQREVAVRDDRFRLIARPDGEPRLLIDDRGDPESTVDRSREEPARLQALRAALEELRGRTSLASPRAR